MFLALDIGNSAVKGAFFDGARLVHSFRLEHDEADMPILWVQELLGHIRHADVQQVGVASVVPELTKRVREAVHDALGHEIVLVRSDMPLPFRMAYETPETLGADRLAAAAGAWVIGVDPADRDRRAAIVVDAGTALTFEVVDRGSYLGGVIAPGPPLQIESLHGGTAQLPEVEPVLPDHVIGRTSRSAIQSGVLHGFLDAVAGLLDRLRRELPPDPYIVATGGWAPLLGEHVPGLGRIEPDLVLHGIRVLVDDYSRTT